MIEVNLLPTANTLSKQDLAIREKIRWVVGVTLILLILDLTVFVVVKQFYTMRVAQLLTNRERLLTLAQEQAVGAQTLATIESKLASIAVIGAQRSDIAAIVTDVQSLLGGGVELSDFRADNTGKVSFIAKVTDVAAFDSFVKTVTDLGKPTKLTNIVIGSLRQDQGRGLTFQFSATYQKK